MGTNLLFLCVSFGDFFKIFSVFKKIAPLFNRYKMIDKRDEI